MSSWCKFLWTWSKKHHRPAVHHSLPFRLVVRLHAPRRLDQCQERISALQFKSVPIWKRTLYPRESTLRSTNELLWHLQNCWFGSAQRRVEMWTLLLLGRSLQCRLGKEQWVAFYYILCILTRTHFYHFHAALISSNLKSFDLELVGKLDEVKLLNL